MDERVLLVEDDPSIREMAALGLFHAGFRVTSCADGREGLERLSRDSFDLAVLDVMLPSLDREKITREVRKDNRDPDRDVDRSCRRHGRRRWPGARRSR